MEEEKLEAFISFRNELIDQLDQGKINKFDFIRKNYEYISKYEVNPYGDIESVSGAAFAYQYFNSKAKYYLSKAFEIELKDPEEAYELRELGFENYEYKNNVIKKVLELINYKNVEAFYIEMNSKALEGELFEIVLLDYEKMIFHTKDLLILNRLKKNNCFSKEIKDSLIAEYINEKY
jgi:hypothetical protein